MIVRQKKSEKTIWSQLNTCRLKATGMTKEKGGEKTWVSSGNLTRQTNKGTNKK